jgi:hypothetical protein
VRALSGSIVLSDARSAGTLSRELNSARATVRRRQSHAPKGHDLVAQAAVERAVDAVDRHVFDGHRRVLARFLRSVRPISVPRSPMRTGAAQQPRTRTKSRKRSSRRRDRARPAADEADGPLGADNGASL